MNPKTESVSRYIVLIERHKDWKNSFPNIPVITVDEYLSGNYNTAFQKVRFINLCRSYKYLSKGYYSSLLAEARKEKIIPSVETIRDLSNKSIYTHNAETIDESLPRKFPGANENLGVTGFQIYIFFGITDISELKEAARLIYDGFRFPLLKVEFRYDKSWKLNAIKPLTINAIPPEKEELFIEALVSYTHKKWQSPRTKNVARYDLAILHNPQEKLPPSNKQALRNFIRVGKKLNIDVELIQKKDYTRLAEYDALFIRETTAIEHYTYLFARKAQNEGMIVIDDPNSIRLCTNKVFLAEILQRNKIATPKTLILLKDDIEYLESQLGYPVVLKIPEGAFSLGVFKATNREEAQSIMDKLFKESDIILVQEYLYTEFDWRVGVLNNEPLFVSKYFMSKSHWQIYNHSASGKDKTGEASSIAIQDVPKEVLKLALSATKLIGDGLYGVDLKKKEKGVYVIEINDNPNIDAGVEDILLKDEIYLRIMKEFAKRIESKGLNSKT